MNPSRNLRLLLATLAVLVAPFVSPLHARQDDAPPAKEPVLDLSADHAGEDTDAADTQPGSKTSRKASKTRARKHAEDPGDDSVVSVGTSASLAAGRHVNRDFVVVFGDGKVDGTVDGNVVVILGKATINGTVGGDVVNVGTGVTLGPKAVVDGDVVGVGGGVSKAEGAVVSGEVIPVGIGADILPELMKIPDWAKRYFSECILKLRPLAFSIGWPWGMFGALFALHFLLAALLPAASSATERAMSERPGATALMAVLAVPMTLFAMVLLSITGIGPLLLLVAALVAVLVGKVAVMQFLGSRMAGMFGGARPAAMACFLIGTVLVALLYATPFIGFFVWLTLSLWGFGAALVALLGRSNARTPDAKPPAPSTRTQTLRAEPAMGSVPAGSPAFAGPGEFAVLPNPPSPEPAREMPRSSPADSFKASAGEWARRASGPGIDPGELATLPRPGFTVRLAALVIDWIVVGMLLLATPGFITRHLPGPVVFGVLYFAAMIAWRGTTLGGLVAGLRVVRLDGRPLDRATAIVRAVGAILSAFAAGIGWLWPWWDPEKQTWHDKFAGTVVVQAPRSLPLV